MDSACCACSKHLKEYFVGSERASIRHIGTLIDRPNSAWITFLARGGETFGVDWRGSGRQLITELRILQASNASR